MSRRSLITRVDSADSARHWCSFSCKSRGSVLPLRSPHRHPLPCTPGTIQRCAGPRRAVAPTSSTASSSAQPHDRGRAAARVNRRRRATPDHAIPGRTHPPARPPAVFRSPTGAPAGPRRLVATSSWSPRPLPPRSGQPATPTVAHPPATGRCVVSTRVTANTAHACRCSSQEEP